MPLLSGKLQMNDSLLATIATLMTAIGLTASAFVTELWQYYLAHVTFFKRPKEIHTVT